MSCPSPLNSDTGSSAMKILYETQIPAPKTPRRLPRAYTQTTVFRRTSGGDSQHSSSLASSSIKLSKLVKPSTLVEVLAVASATSPIMPYETMMTSVVVRGLTKTQAPSRPSNEATEHTGGYLSFQSFNESKPAASASREPSTAKKYCNNIKTCLWRIMNKLGAGAQVVSDFYTNGERKWETEYSKESKLSETTAFGAIDRLEKKNMRKIELASERRRQKSLGHNLREYWRPTPSDITLRDGNIGCQDTSSDTFAHLCTENEGRIRVGNGTETNIPSIIHKTQERIQQRQKRHKFKAQMREPHPLLMKRAERKYNQPSPRLGEQQIERIQRPRLRRLPQLVEERQQLQQLLLRQEEEQAEKQYHQEEVQKWEQLQPCKQRAHQAHLLPSTPASTTPLSQLKTIQEVCQERDQEVQDREQEGGYFPFMPSSSFSGFQHSISFRGRHDADSDDDGWEEEEHCCGFESYAGGEMCLRHESCLVEGMGLRGE